MAGNATMTAAGAGHRPGAARASRRSSWRPGRCRRRCWPPSSACTCTRGRARSSSPRSGAYVGGDIVAGMLASGMDRDKRLRLFIDVGTNCEIVLGNGERLVSTAAPAGSGVRGCAIRCGMRAADGAIVSGRAIFAPSPATLPAETMRSTGSFGTRPIRTAQAGDR